MEELIKLITERHLKLTLTSILIKPEVYQIFVKLKSRNSNESTQISIISDTDDLSNISEQIINKLNN